MGTRRESLGGRVGTENVARARAGTPNRNCSGLCGITGTGTGSGFGFVPGGMLGRAYGME